MYDLRTDAESLKLCIQLFIQLLDKYSHVFICIPLKQTLSSGQKSVYTVKILISKQIAVAAVLHFGEVFDFWKLINKSLPEWFLIIMCEQHTLTRIRNYTFNRNHSTLFLIKKRRLTDATRGVLYKKLFAKFSKYSQESTR